MLNVSIENLREQKDELLDKMEALEEKCDTLEICKEDDACKRCETYAEIESLSENVEELENKIEELLRPEED